MPCSASENQVVIDQSKFWDANGIHWEPHRIGWAVAGGCTAITVIISLISVLQHCRNYTKPRQQRQILRILYMPPVYAIISFLSYRFFRYYTYYSLIYIAYEAITLSAFLLLLIEYVADTASGHSPDRAIERKDKRPLPIPFCCWRYRPTKAYFMYAVKWAVLQYVIIRPAASIVGVICERMDILCANEGFNYRYANVYIEAVNFVSISVALYGLLVFYGLMAEELKGKRPMAKFLSIKLIVMFTFYQAFIFNALEGRVIKATQYWTATNIADGLNALSICVEMVIFSALMWWAYTAKEYRRKEGSPCTSVWRPIWDSINYMDFLREIGSSFRFFFFGKSQIQNQPNVMSSTAVFPVTATSTGYRPGTMTEAAKSRRMSFAEAFGIEQPQTHAYEYPLQSKGLGGNRPRLGLGQAGVVVDDGEEREALTKRAMAVGSMGSPSPSASMEERKLGREEDEEEEWQRERQRQVVYQAQQQQQQQWRPEQRQQQRQQQQQYQQQQHQQQQQTAASSNYTRPAGQPIPRSLQPYNGGDAKGPESEANLHLGYYQSAYGGVQEEQQPKGPSSFVPPLQQSQQGQEGQQWTEIPRELAPGVPVSHRDSFQTWTGPRAV